MFIIVTLIQKKNKQSKNNKGSSGTIHVLKDKCMLSTQSASWQQIVGSAALILAKPLNEFPTFISANNSILLCSVQKK